MQQTSEELRALLGAYRMVMQAAWPGLHPLMQDRSASWPTASAAALKLELDDYLTEASLPTCRVCLFWKLGANFTFGGCNAAFARDAGLERDQIPGITDYDTRLPWARQAAKYRLDDKGIVDRGVPNLDILERHTAADGTVGWVRAAKAPIKTAEGTVLGIFGMYEVLDQETGRRLFAEQQARARPG